MATVALSPNAIPYILKNKNTNNNKKCPIVQVTNIQKVAGGRDKWRIHISDGHKWAYAYLTEHFKIRHELQKGSIITVDVWRVKEEATMNKIEISKGSMQAAKHPIIGASTYYDEQQIALTESVCYLLHLKLICISILCVICM